MNAIEESYLLGNRYKIEKRIGVGGMAEVYKAQDTVLERPVAVKVLLSKYADDTAFSERFKNEARSAARLGSPHIVGVHDWGEDEGRCYIVMEYVQGTDLKKIVKRQGRLTPRRVAEVASQVCSALAEAHAHGVIHRDIKSSNIMIQQSGNVKIMDFGIAQAAGEVRGGSVMGTVHYMSPEQIKGRVPVPASDLYSLGVVMYETATGQLPFRAKESTEVADKQLCEAPVPPSEVNQAVDSDLEMIILKAMEKEPARRYASALEFRHELEAYLESPSHARASRLEGDAPGFWALAFAKAPAALRGKVVKVAGPVVLGRGSKANISIPDSSVSAEHVRVTPDGVRLLVEDLGSTNGVCVNGVKISQAAYCGPGDEISIGSVAMLVGCK